MTRCPECDSNRIKLIRADRRMMPPEDIYECRDCEHVWAYVVGLPEAEVTS